MSTSTASPAAWLITRFIDSDAKFLFVPVSWLEQVVKETGAIPFDAPGVDLGHHDGRCSFETIIERYGLKEKGLLRLAQSVHGADTDDFASVTFAQVTPSASSRSFSSPVRDLSRNARSSHSSTPDSARAAQDGACSARRSPLHPLSLSPTHSYRSALIISMRDAWRAGRSAASTPKISPAAMAARTPASGNVYAIFM